MFGGRTTKAMQIKAVNLADSKDTVQLSVQHWDETHPVRCSYANVSLYADLCVVDVEVVQVPPAENVLEHEEHYANRRRMIDVYLSMFSGDGWGKLVHRVYVQLEHLCTSNHQDLYVCTGAQIRDSNPDLQHLTCFRQPHEALKFIDQFLPGTECGVVTVDIQNAGETITMSFGSRPSLKIRGNANVRRYHSRSGNLC